MYNTANKRTEQVRDVTTFWQDRGYRPELAILPADEAKDPKGEIAYQRAFIEAAQADPPRLPNPNHYPNSESARAYTQRRLNMNIVKVEKRTVDEDSQSVPRRFRDSDTFSATMKQNGSVSPVSASSRSSFSQQPSGSNLRQDVSPDGNYQYSPQSAQFPSQISRLTPMEPRMSAPSGPTNRLR